MATTTVLQPDHMTDTPSRVPDWTIIADLDQRDPRTWTDGAVGGIVSEAIAQLLQERALPEIERRFAALRETLPVDQQVALDQVRLLCDETLWGAIELATRLTPIVREHWRSPAEVVQLAISRL